MESQDPESQHENPKNTYISAISNGLMALMPILILGAIFS